MQTPGLKGIVIRTCFSTMICCSVVSLLWLEVVRTNPFLSLLSFFLLPVIVGVLLGIAIFEQQERRMLMVTLLSFPTPLVYYFMQYSKQLQHS